MAAVRAAAEGMLAPLRLGASRAEAGRLNRLLVPAECHGGAHDLLTCSTGRNAEEQAQCNTTA